jgi:hypothetical protein
MFFLSRIFHQESHFSSITAMFIVKRKNAQIPLPHSHQVRSIL